MGFARSNPVFSLGLDGVLGFRFLYLQNVQNLNLLEIISIIFLIRIMIIFFLISRENKKSIHL